MEPNELKEAMQRAGRAFADGLAENEDRRREEEDARLIAEMRSYALEQVKEILTSKRRITSERVVHKVGSYCSKARKDALDKLKNDKRMPRTINYLERYNALLGMDNRAEVLRRLDQTIEKAEVIIDEADEVDVDAALTDAAQIYAERVSLLDGIVVVAAEEEVEDETKSVSKTLLTAKDDSEDSLGKIVEDAFKQRFLTQTDEGERLLAIARSRNERMEELREEIVEATFAASEAVTHAMHADAESIAGNIYRLPEIPSFEGGVVLAAELDVDELRELAVEVRKSFGTFKQVVRDNGLFSAFASEGSFGACNGWRYGFWWDDFLYDMSEFEGEIPGRKKVKDIATDVEEDEGGDSLAKSVERMRDFNKKRYWGMLDDEFDEHVEAFWYGFKKLMEGVNGLYRMNPSAFNKYCNDIAEGAQEAAVEVGVGYMDTHQADEFVKEIDRRAKE